MDSCREMERCSCDQNYGRVLRDNVCADERSGRVVLFGASSNKPRESVSLERYGTFLSVAMGLGARS
jgi:hypothetical protein